MFALGPAFFKQPAVASSAPIGSGTNYVASSTQVTPKGRLSLTGLATAYADEGTRALTVPFPFQFFGTDYGNSANSGIYVCANSYIGFGTAKSEYQNFTPSNPGKGIFIGASDRAWQAVYAGLEGEVYRVRFEGCDGYTNTAANVFWEMSFYPNGVIQLVIGGFVGLANGGVNVKAISSGAAYTNTLTLTANTSYALIPDATGSNWTISEGSIVAA